MEQEQARSGSLRLGLTIVAIVVGVYVASAVWEALRPGLRDLPGPFLAKFSSVWMIRLAVRSQMHVSFNELHQKYGPVVRIGPNKVSIADPEAIAVIYGIGGAKFEKSKFYETFTAAHGGAILDNLFASTDVAWQKHVKSVVAPAYSLSYLRHLEPLVDECTDIFMKAMKDLSGQTINMGEWLQWYAFDAIGNITFSQTFDFMRRRADPLNIVDSIEAGNHYNTVVGQTPWLHPYLLGNSTLLGLMARIPAVAKANPITTINLMINNAMDTTGRTTVKADRGNYFDFLTNVRAEKPGALTDRDMWSCLTVNLFAGSDTTAISLRSVVYFLLKNPRVYGKLKDEIKETFQNKDPAEFVSYEEGSKMTYLQATLKESLRLHPGVSYPLERIVPAGGAYIAGHHFPAGTVVGVHGWVVHRDVTVFGDDAEEFRPERWLDDQDPEQLKRMNHAFIPFGAGSRTCLGKHISMLEMTKLIPHLLRNFDMEWASDKADWEVFGSWFARQKGLIVRLQSVRN